MNDDFLSQFRESPDPEFVRALYERIAPDSNRNHATPLDSTYVVALQVRSRQRRTYALPLVAALMAVAVFGSIVLSVARFPRVSSSQTDPDRFVAITADNAERLAEFAQLGRGSIYDLAWSPDGQTLAVASATGVWLYDTAASDGPPQVIENSAAHSGTLAFSPNGALLAFTRDDHAVVVWDRVERRETFVTKPEANPINWLVFSPDRRLLAAVSGTTVWQSKLESTARVWNLAAGAEQTTIALEDNRFITAQFSPDSAALITVSEQGVERWDTATGEQINAEPIDVTDTVLPPGTSDARLYKAALSPDGDFLVEMSYSPVEHGGQGGIAFSPTFRLWSTEGAKQPPSKLRTFGDQTIFAELALGTDGMRVAVPGADGTNLRVLDAASGDRIARLPGDKPVEQIAVSPDGARIATASDGVIRLWDIATDKQVAALEDFSSAISDLAFSPDGTTLAATSSVNTVQLWNVTAPASALDARAVLNSTWGYTSATAFSADGTQVLTVVNSPPIFAPEADQRYVLLQAWDALTGARLHAARFKKMAAVSSNLLGPIALSNDGSLAATSYYFSPIEIWDTAALLSGGEAHLLTTAGNTADAEVEAIFSLDNKRLAVPVWDYASRRLTLELWDVQTGENRGFFTKQWGTPESHYSASRPDIAFSPDSSVLVLGSADGLYLWDMSQGLNGEPARMNYTETRTDDGETYQLVVGKPAFSPDGTLLATTTGPNIQLWTVRGLTAKSLGSWPLDGGSCTALAFSPDGKYLVAGGADGIIRVWGVAER